MTEYGIWSKVEDGFIERQYGSYESAMDGLIFIVDRDGLDGDDLSVRELCPDHTDDEEPREGCERCNEDGEDEKDEEEEDA